MTDHDNPLLQAWDEPLGLPPFERVRVEHFAPTSEEAMAVHRTEIGAACLKPQD